MRLHVRLSVVVGAGPVGVVDPEDRIIASQH